MGACAMATRHLLSGSRSLPAAASYCSFAGTFPTCAFELRVVATRTLSLIEEATFLSTRWNERLAVFAEGTLEDNRLQVPTPPHVMRFCLVWGDHRRVTNKGRRVCSLPMAPVAKESATNLIIVCDAEDGREGGGRAKGGGGSCIAPQAAVAIPFACSVNSTSYLSRPSLW